MFLDLLYTAHHRSRERSEKGDEAMQMKNQLLLLFPLNILFLCIFAHHIEEIQCELQVARQITAYQVFIGAMENLFV